VIKSTPPFPTRQEIINLIEESPHKIGKREIARAFKLNPEQKKQLKKLLRDMSDEGIIQKRHRQKFVKSGDLPEFLVVRVSRINEDGDVFALPLNWDGNKAPPPILISPERGGRPELGIGDTALIRISKSSTGLIGKTIRPINRVPSQVLGILSRSGKGFRIRQTKRGERHELFVEKGDHGEAESGDLVRAEIIPGKNFGLRRARVIESLHSKRELRDFSLVAIHQHEIPFIFPSDVEAVAKEATAAPKQNRADLRGLPLVTIDGVDARDFDDAVWAEPDTSPTNPGGWHCIVAIADVSWYVQPGSALDLEAQKRGNSVYFPDRVVPMLPETLSNGWCSLKPDEDRPCVAVHFWINTEGKMLGHKFERALMRSVARLTYDQIQAAYDGSDSDLEVNFINRVVHPLYQAYFALSRARDSRQVLELELAERHVVLSPDGTVKIIRERARLESHKLIEEFMIAANVAAAEILETAKTPFLYRVHDQPSIKKINALSIFLKSLNLNFSKGQTVKPIQFNQILRKVSDTPYQQMVAEIVLRSQAQAEYSTHNIGHFGLSLRRYCHFTSPIRRYADLLVHRSLLSSLKLEEDDNAQDLDMLNKFGKQLSNLERRAASAEREAIDRYTAQYLSNQIGAKFNAQISGATRAGLFIKLDQTGADGLVPIRSLPQDFYVHNETLHQLKGRKTGRTYRIGQKIEVTLLEAIPITGGMIFEILGDSPSSGSSKRASEAKTSKHRKNTKQNYRRSKSD